MGIQLGELVLGSGKTDLKSFHLAQPALAFGLDEAGQEVVADLDQAAALVGLGTKHRAADAGMFVDARGTERASADADGELAALEVPEALMDSMTREDLEGEEFQDTYTEALEQIIEAKREDREPPKLQEPESKPGQIVDLMAALNESVQKARASRGEDADVHELPKRKAAKKQLAKKTTKKSAAKKTSGRPAAQRLE
ncbi:hypothetical protein AB0H94_35810 [Streptomyces purpurascens]|uniref:hypothetical protein n=1 Tax=Streptomyces purpurascens TaxID=1924 RepID=UPI0033D5F7E7